jgi:hypothetical protein
MALACLQREPGGGARLRPGVLGGGQGRRGTGHPGGPWVRQLLEVRCTVERAVGPQVRQAVRGLELPHGRGDARPTGTWITGRATAGLPPQGQPRGVCHDPAPPPVVEVGPLSAAVARRERQDLCVRLLATVVAPSARAAGALAMGEGRRQPQAVRGRARDAPGACCHASRIARVRSAA